MVPRIHFIDIYLTKKKVIVQSVIYNTTIRNITEAEKSIIDWIQTKKLKFYGHQIKMNDFRLPKNITNVHCMERGEEENGRNNRRAKFNF